MGPGGAGGAPGRRAPERDVAEEEQRGRGLHARGGEQAPLADEQRGRGQQAARDVRHDAHAEQRLSGARRDPVGAAPRKQEERRYERLRTYVCRRPVTRSRHMRVQRLTPSRRVRLATEWHPTAPSGPTEAAEQQSLQFSEA
jgi:hypothetical protein